jgi:hypothetical protein
LLDGKEAPKAGEAVRSVVQVGAYADLSKAKEARAKLESAGLKLTPKKWIPKTVNAFEFE